VLTRWRVIARVVAVPVNVLQAAELIDLAVAEVAATASATAASRHVLAAAALLAVVVAASAGVPLEQVVRGEPTAWEAAVSAAGDVGDKSMKGKAMRSNV